MDDSQAVPLTRRPLAEQVDRLWHDLGLGAGQTDDKDAALKLSDIATHIAGMQQMLTGQVSSADGTSPQTLQDIIDAARSPLRAVMSRLELVDGFAEQQQRRANDAESRALQAEIDLMLAQVENKPVDVFSEGVAWAALQNLVNQLTVLQHPDESTLWRMGGQPLRSAYDAAREVLKQDRHLPQTVKDLTSRLAEGIALRGVLWEFRRILLDRTGDTVAVPAALIGRIQLLLGGTSPSAEHAIVETFPMLKVIREVIIYRTVLKTADGYDREAIERAQARLFAALDAAAQRNPLVLAMAHLFRARH